MEAHRSLVPQGGDGLELLAALAAAVLLEGLVKEAADAVATAIRMDAHEVHVTHRCVRAHEAEQEADDRRLILDDAREPAELVEEQRVRERARGPAPPVIDHADDQVEIGL